MSFLARIRNAFTAEPVTCIAGACAVLTLPLAWGSATPADYLASIDFHTLAVLFCLMLIVAGFRTVGLLDRLARALIVRARDVRELCAALIACCFFGSMVVTNDVSLIVFVPLAHVSLRLAGRLGYFLRTVVLQTVAANLGSSLSPVGNPQNIYLQSHYNLDLATFGTTMAPIIIVGAIGILALVIVFLPAGSMDALPLPERKRTRFIDRRSALLLALFGACLACVAGVIPYTALLGIVALAALITFRELFRKVDYALLGTFVFFFILVCNLQHIAPVRDAISALTAQNPFAAAVATSQVISNVPAAVLLSGFTPQGTALLAGSNVGGLGTPIASLASLIALKLFTQLAAAPGTRPRTSRFLLFFTGVNVLLLGALCMLVAFTGC